MITAKRVFRDGSPEGLDYVDAGANDQPVRLMDDRRELTRLCILRPLCERNTGPHGSPRCTVSVVGHCGRGGCAAGTDIQGGAVDPQTRPLAFRPRTAAGEGRASDGCRERSLCSPDIRTRDFHGRLFCRGPSSGQGCSFSGSHCGAHGRRHHQIEYMEREAAKGCRKIAGFPPTGWRRSRGHVRGRERHCPAAPATT